MWKHESKLQKEKVAWCSVQDISTALRLTDKDHLPVTNVENTVQYYVRKPNKN